MQPNDLIKLKSCMFRTGHNDSAVRIIKTFLNSNRRTSTVSLKPNNLFDAETAKALADFQKSKNLNPTGAMNVKTWLAIGAEMNPIQIKVVSAANQTVRDLLTLGYRSKFPFNKVNPQNPTGITGFVHKKGPSPGNRSFSGDFSFRVFVTVFAPFDWFGPLNLSQGDGNNRRFGHNLRASYRLQAISKMIASPGNHKYPYSVTLAAPATTSFLFIPPTPIIPSIPTSMGLNPSTIKMANSEGYISDEDTGEVQPNGLIREGNDIRYHFHGNDDAFALWGKNSLVASDIDVHANIYFNHSYTSKPDTYLMTIGGQITGDQFPAVETYVIDRIGNGLMLGVWQVREGDGPVFTRDGRLGIVGDKQLPMIDIDVSVIVENGIFTGVQKSGRVISLAQHNKQFTDLPTVKPGKFQLRGKSLPIPRPAPTPTP